ncbi:MAG: type II CRISPR-associated endonuclease Cas1 [Bacillota bacterium]|nr:type II CRISPR-associated endonuclease Cas1 [Bacillota bacterium]
MAFRTLEISKPSDVHVHKQQLEIANEEGTIKIPLEDLSTIVCSGANIRMSTMAQAMMAERGISLMVIDEKYQPACIVLPIKSNVRQTMVMRKQIALEKETKNGIWSEMINRKIENQAMALTILGKDGSEKIAAHTKRIGVDDIDSVEANAAKDYFYHLHPGINRRIDSPLNSCLNYGYAVLRNAIIRSSILAGFQLSIGIHHDNYLNTFNLADDLIEPWRPFVDLIAAPEPGMDIILSKSKRRELAMVLHHACVINGRKMSVLTGIDEMVASLRERVVSESGACLKLPTLIPIEVIESIKE